jgi:hypothetical protein
MGIKGLRRRRSAVFLCEKTAKNPGKSVNFMLILQHFRVSGDHRGRPSPEAHAPRRRGTGQAGGRGGQRGTPAGRPEAGEGRPEAGEGRPEPGEAGRRSARAEPEERPSRAGGAPAGVPLCPSRAGGAPGETAAGGVGFRRPA